MTPMLFGLLVFYLLGRGVECVLTFLNLRFLKAHGAEVPAGFEQEVDGGVLIKMRDYTLERARVDLAGSAVVTAAVVLFFFGGLLDWYNNRVAGLGWPLIPSALLFYLVLLHGETLLKAPFDLYRTFVVEKRYGFNTRSIGLWCLDTVKALALATVLYGVLILGFFGLIQAFPGLWWLMAWGFLFVFSLFLLYLSPSVLEPLFNKFTPVEDAELVEKIKSLLAKAGLSVSRIFAMDASKRSTHSNAYLSGIGHVKRIVLFDTLLRRFSHDEILAILAHEVGHWKKKHILKRLALTECAAFIGMYAAFLLVRGNGIAVLFEIGPPTLYAKLLLAGFLGSLALFPLRPLSGWYSRLHEAEADAFAVALTGNPKALAQALVLLGRDNLSNLHPHPWYAAFYYSHPPLPRRVAQLARQA